MEIKDLIGVIVSILFILLFRFLQDGKKKPIPPIPELKKRMPLVKKEKRVVQESRPTWPASKPEAVYRSKRDTSTPLAKSLFSNKSSLQKGFIMQEILKRPYE